MIITRTPFRISFAGGGSDFAEYYQKETGAVVSTTIDKYVFLSMHPLFNKKGYFLKYSSNEIVDRLDQITHPIIREVFKEHDISGVDFNSSSDVPAGTGLGSSSSFTVGLINLCYAYQHTYVKREYIAKEACKVEISKLKSPIGKQDQYATAMGGLNFIQFKSDGSVCVEKIVLSEYKRTELENSLMLFYLGEGRQASSVLEEQKSKIEENRAAITKMVNLAKNLSYALKDDDIDDFGGILHANWMYKKELASNVTNPEVDELYTLALRKGANGGKLLGAGGTGFLLLCAQESEQENIKKALKLYEVPFKFEDSGTTVIY